MWADTVDPSDPLPLHAQLERSIRVGIASGRLKTGDQLPTVRQLAVELRINANTVDRVYTHLERLGVLGTRRGVGTFVQDSPASVTTQNQKARDADLAAIAGRALAEASARGFTATELRRALVTLSRGGTS
jgi:GntR family transcriptional regulator